MSTHESGDEVTHGFTAEWIIGHRNKFDTGVEYRVQVLLRPIKRTWTPDTSEAQVRKLKAAARVALAG